MSSNNKYPVLVIPRVYSNIRENRIRGIIKELNIGVVKRIDLKKWVNKEGKTFNKVFVHLIWNTDSETEKIVSRLQDGKEIKIVYDDPWFWKVSAYKSEGTKHVIPPKPMILANDDLPDHNKVIPNKEVIKVNSLNKKPDINYGGDKGMPNKTKSLRTKRLPLSLKNPDEMGTSPIDMDKIPHIPRQAYLTTN